MFCRRYARAVSFLLWYGTIWESILKKLYLGVFPRKSPISDFFSVRGIASSFISCRYHSDFAIGVVLVVALAPAVAIVVVVVALYLYLFEFAG